MNTEKLSKEELEKEILSICDDPMRVAFWFDTLFERHERGKLTQQQIFDMITSNDPIPEESQK